VSASPVPQPNHTELYGRVGIPLSIGILIAGLTAFATGRISLGVFLGFLCIGFVGLMVMVYLLEWHRFTTLDALISAVTALLVSWVLAYVLWPQPTPYINPLHTEVTKWNMTRNLVAWSVDSNTKHPNCDINIINYSETYPEKYAADFEEILETVRWNHSERVSKVNLPNGISIWRIPHNQPSKDCADELNDRINTDGRTRSGGTNNYVAELTDSEAHDRLQSCSPGVGCVEVTFGNEDTTR
jgi:hypothetical protein